MAPAWVGEAEDINREKYHDHRSGAFCFANAKSKIGAARIANGHRLCRRSTRRQDHVKARRAYRDIRRDQRGDVAGLGFSISSFRPCDSQADVKSSGIIINDRMRPRSGCT